MHDTAPYVWSGSFEGIDELAAEVRHWDLDFWQLDRGRCECGFLQYGLGEIHVGEVRYGRAITQRIGPPSNVYTLGVLADRGAHQVWRGQRATGDDLVVFPPGGEATAVSPSGFRAFTCSLSASALSRFCDERDLEQIDALCQTQVVVHCEPAVLAVLRAMLDSLSRAIDGQPAILSDPRTMDRITQELPRHLLAAVATASGSSFPATTRKREAALVRAEEFIARHAEENIRMADLHRAARVSPRTLEYAFVERFGLTPKAFIKAYRLNKVREQLRRADSSAVGVQEIAGRWGFWHMSSFAADYFRQFEELPSQTLSATR